MKSILHFKSKDSGRLDYLTSPPHFKTHHPSPHHPSPLPICCKQLVTELRTFPCLLILKPLASSQLAWILVLLSCSFVSSLDLGVLYINKVIHDLQNYALWVESVPPKNTLFYQPVRQEWVLSRPVLECNQFSPPLFFITMDLCRTTRDMGCTKNGTSKQLAV